MIYVGQICYDPENSSLPRCSWGNYTFESNYFVSLLQESEPSELSFGSWLIEWFGPVWLQEEVCSVVRYFDAYWHNY